MSLRALRGLPTALVGMFVAAVLFTAFTATSSNAQMPADKFAVTGSDVDEVNDNTTILAEQMRVSSPADLILQVTAECSILTQLLTNNEQPASDVFGSVRLRVEIDGVNVPVATNDIVGGGGADDTPNPDVGEGDDDDEVGEVTFCNRAYGREVTDGEDPADGIDSQDDYIATRAANAFNWIALNAGGDVYDADGDNILNIAVIADYDVETTGMGNVAEAFVGSRTLVVEPTHLAVNETTDQE
ncbi:MAG TPA: hypothetical protein VNP73_11710 [Actinomycetota bacterium]|nr:hypothetical protein [Actinomycetota bacterium]